VITETNKPPSRRLMESQHLRSVSGAWATKSTLIIVDLFAGKVEPIVIENGILMAANRYDLSTMEVRRGFCNAR